jgi:hypothetical protein
LRGVVNAELVYLNVATVPAQLEGDLLSLAAVIDDQQDRLHADRL